MVVVCFKKLILKHQPQNFRKLLCLYTAHCKMGIDLTETVVNASPPPALTLQRTVGGCNNNNTNDDNDNVVVIRRELRLLFLGCESQPPYGPYEHTATLFLDLITASLQEATGGYSTEYHVSLDVYHASKGHLPAREAYIKYDGIILPGSFNSAYETEPWILQLSKIIQEEIVAKELPTLGVCFGHQLYAHSFHEGSAIQCPAGPQAGRKVSTMSLQGQKWFPSFQDLQLYYTHGDMVASLPPQGHVLSGTETVPIQTAIYFSNDDNNGQQRPPKPIAVTFQAHPEYGSSRSLGLDRTLNQIIDAMHERHDISDEEYQRVKADASAEFDTVQKYSIECMVVVGRILGWFPEKEPTGVNNNYS
jgi:GMP synthase (glutamine-hydrolysing)